MPAEVFRYSDYRAFLTFWLEEQAQSWGLVTKMAAAAGCQRSYLSKVLKGEAHLTPSQAFGAAGFCGLEADETEYFLGLVEKERASSAAYRSYVERRNQTLKRNQEDLARRTGRRVPDHEDSTALYYSAWYWTAIHILVSIKEFGSVASVARRLQLPPPLVELVLTRLAKDGFVRQERGKWSFAAKESHVPRTSPFVGFHHANWRQKAVLDAQDPTRDGIHFTVVQSVSRRDVERLRQLILGVIAQFSEIAGPSAEEELVCFNCDLFVP